MAMARSTIVGVFTNATSAENAIEALHNAGFTNDQLTYSGHSRMGGGFWESVKSMFGSADTTSDSVVRDLMGLGLTQDEATYYAQEHQAGHPIVAVNAGDRAEEAAQILQTSGGYSYAAGTGAASGTVGQSSAYNQDTAYTGTDQYAQQGTYTTTDQYNQPAGYTQTTDYDRDRAAGTYDRTADYDRDRAAGTYDRTADYAGTDVDTDEARRLRLREERLQAEKQTVQSGEVRLGKDVVTEQQSIDVPVQHEEVYIQRQDLGDRVSDVPVGQDETIHVPVREEQVNVTKTPVETGEVTLGKRTVQDTQRVSDTVQREEARIEREGDTPIRDTTTGDDIANR